MTNPDPDVLGGVSAYVAHIRGRFHEEVEHFTVGRRAGEKRLPARMRRFLADAARFSRRLGRRDIDLVHINPSLDWKGIVRDGLLTRLAICRGVPVVVFFHGWTWPVAKRVDRRWQWLFRFLFGKASGFIVLDDDVAETLRRWGINKTIKKEVTVVGDEEIEAFDLEASLKKRLESEEWRVLFMGRVVKEKGIYEAIDTMALLSKNHPRIQLLVAGDGEELENAKAHVAARHLENVQFMGRVRGDARRQTYENAHVFFLPSHREGLPGAMVEAMAYALPIVTVRVGGIPDIFENGKHGYMLEQLEPEQFASSLELLYQDKIVYERIARYNARFAIDHFTASHAVKRLEKFYGQCLARDRRDDAGNPGPAGGSAS